MDLIGVLDRGSRPGDRASNWRIAREVKERRPLPNRGSRVVVKSKTARRSLIQSLIKKEFVAEEGSFERIDS